MFGYTLHLCQNLFICRVQKVQRICFGADGSMKHSIKHIIKTNTQKQAKNNENKTLSHTAPCTASLEKLERHNYMVILVQKRVLLKCTNLFVDGGIRPTSSARNTYSTVIALKQGQALLLWKAVYQNGSLPACYFAGTKLPDRLNNVICYNTL